jgi:CRP-like cAMP-binding protein
MKEWGDYMLTYSRHTNGGVAREIRTETRNSLIAALPSLERERLREHLRPCSFQAGQALYEAGDHVERVFLLNKGLVSLVLTSQEGTQVECGIVGREGVIGLPSALGDDIAVTRAVTQIDASGYWLPARAFREEFRRGGVLSTLILRQQQLIIAQASQAALCNRLHTVEERLARWLLTLRDRIGSDQIYITQEFIAHMLGTRRSGVTVAAGILREAGLIDYTRGRISIVNDKRLEETSCECYGVLRSAFAKMYDGMPQTY